MLKIERKFQVRTVDGVEMILCECTTEKDFTTMYHKPSTVTEERYYRQYYGGMRAMTAQELEQGVYQLENGMIVSETNHD